MGIGKASLIEKIMGKPRKAAAFMTHINWGAPSVTQVFLRGSKD